MFVGSKKKLVIKNIYSKKIFVQQIFGPKILLSKKCLGQK